MECNNLKELVLKLQSQLSGETQARRQAESQCLQDKRESDMKLREALGQIEKANHSYQMVWNMKTGLEEKHNKNSEQKKILVKEVKQLRKRIEESDDLNDQMSVVNDKLIAVTSDLRQQVETQRKKIDTQHAAILASTDLTLHEAIRSPSSSDKLHLLGSSEAGTTSASGSSGDDKGDDDGDGGGDDSGNGGGDVTDEADKILEEARALTAKSSLSHFQAEARHHKTPSSHSTPGAVGPSAADKQGGSTSPSDLDQLLNERSHPNPTSPLTPPVDVVTRGGRTASMEFDFPTDSSSATMLNMDWLSPEQRQLAEQRQQQQQGAGAGAGGGGGLDTSQSGAGGAGAGGGRSSGNFGGLGLNLGGGGNKTEKRSSMAMFKDAMSGLSIPGPMDIHLFHSSNSSANSSAEPTTETETSLPSQDMNPSADQTSSSATSSSSSSDVSGQPNVFIDASYENGGKPTCFRCGGTVEGPKYSTCKCAIPALSPLTDEEMEKEEHGIQALKGFFKKSTSKAGDFASVARRKSMAVGKDLFHHNNKDNNSSSSSSSSSSAQSHSGPFGGGLHLFSSGDTATAQGEGSSGEPHSLLDLDDGVIDDNKQPAEASKPSTTTSSLLDL
jgi:hypothetical protein